MYTETFSPWVFMSVRRLLVSCGLAALIALGGVWASSVVDQGATQAETPTPNALPFVLPPLQIGDAGTYFSGPDSFRFQVEETEWVDEDGATVRSPVVRVQRSDLEGQDFRYWLEGNRVAAVGQNLEDAGWGSIHAVTAGSLTDGYRPFGLAFHYQRLETRFDGGLVPLCGLIHSLQGRQVASTSVLESSGCQGPLVYAGAFSKRLGVLEPPSSGIATFENATDRVVVDARVSVPASIESAGRIWDLAGFSPGNLSASLTRGPVAPAISYSAGEYPDDTELVHPFPFRAALAAAMAPPLPGRGRGFMEDFPGAYLAEAIFFERTDSGNRRHEWTLTASNGSEQRSVTVWVASPQADDSTPFFEPLPIAGQQAPPAPAPYVEPTRSPERNYPGLQSMPRFANLTDLAGRWQSIVPANTSAIGANAWGFRIVCGDHCMQPRTETGFGLNHLRSAASGHQVETACFALMCDGDLPSLLVQDMLWVNDAGQIVRRTYTESDSVFAIPTDNHPWCCADAPVGGSQPASTWVASGWSSLTTPATATASILGLVAAVLYYFWPTLQNGVLGWFRSTPAPTDPALRVAIRQAIASHPGIHFHALRRQLDRPGGSIRHHLRVLQDNQEIIVHRKTGFTCYFMAIGTDRHVIAAAGVLKAPAARKMLHGIVQSGGLTMGHAAHYAGLAPGTATYHAARLEEAGLVTRMRIGKSVHLRPTAIAATAATRTD